MSDPLDQDGFPKPQDDFGVSNPYVSPVAEEVGEQGYVTPTGEPLNPWTAMWMRPREVVRQQLETDPARHVLLLAVLAGIAGNLDNSASADESLVVRFGFLVGAMVGGAIFGVIWLYLAGWLVAVTGRLIGGVGLAHEVRTAWAWSYVPYVWMLPLSLALAAIQTLVGVRAMYGDAFAAMTETGVFDFSAFPVWFVPLIVVSVVVFVWKCVITCQAVGEAHRFSGWRGLGAVILALLAIVAVVFLLAVIAIGVAMSMG